MIVSCASKIRSIRLTLSRRGGIARWEDPEKALTEEPGGQYVSQSREALADQSSRANLGCGHGGKE